MTYGGKSGEFFKLFPFLTTLILSDKYILRSRYSKLTDKQFEILWYDYTARTRSVEGLSNLQKITYYEFLFGRGLRYISTGGLVMNSTFKSVFPVFASRKIFSTLIHQKDADVLNYKVFNRVLEKCTCFCKKNKIRRVLFSKNHSFFNTIL